MPKEIFAVKNPQGEIFYPSVTDQGAEIAQKIAVNRFWDKWDDMVEAGWRTVRLMVTEAEPA